MSIFLRTFILRTRPRTLQLRNTISSKHLLLHHAYLRFRCVGILIIVKPWLEPFSDTLSSMSLASQGTIVDDSLAGPRHTL